MPQQGARRVLLIPAMLVNYEDGGRLSWLDEAWIGFPEFKLTAP